MFASLLVRLLPIKSTRGLTGCITLEVKEVHPHWGGLSKYINGTHAYRGRWLLIFFKALFLTVFARFADEELPEKALMT